MSSTKEEIEQRMKEVDSEELAKKRADYYSKWRHLSKEEIDKAIEEEEMEANKGKEKLGLTKDEPKSEAERKEREKRAALKEAKKQWDQRKASEQEQKFVFLNEDGVNKSLKRSDIDHRPVLVIQGAKNSKYELTPEMGSLIKVFVESCVDCEITLHCNLITQHCEVAHCENMKIIVAEPLNTLQIDLSKNVHVLYKQNVLKEGNRVYHAGVSGLTVQHYDYDKKEHDYANIEESEKDTTGNAPAEEYQFITHLIPGRDKLKTERVRRAHGMMPLTDEELAKLTESTNLTEANVRRAKEKKVGGGEAFQNGEYFQAGVFYTEAIQLAPDDKEITSTCLANRAACNLKLGRLEEALDDANAAIAIDPKYTKGWFRKGVALHAMKMYGPAIEALSKAHDLEPKNKQINEAIGFAKVLLAKEIREREEKYKS